MATMTTTNESVPFNEPHLSSGFFQGDIKAGLERIRIRLLDLTTRNRLLSFRHTKKSSLRVINELTDQLFDRFKEGRELVFKPIPRPPRPRAEREEPEQDDPQPEPGLAPRGAAIATETPRAAHYPTAQEYADSLGIPTSFDLPMPRLAMGEEVAQQQASDGVQTLHYPEELESILRSISSAARLAIEETGTNMLYLVFGFLEWYESEESNEARVAPILLYPVSLRRGTPDPRTRVYRYFVQDSGEDVVANISLQEKMRRDFNIAIPDLTDDDTPESYFAKLQPVFESHERWRVRRQITLTLLSFGRLLMYRDLDPQTWPPGTGPGDHPRIKEFFLGVQHQEIAFAPEYRIDHSELRGRVPAVIYDADSSQHSALIDALSGKNLVIEGPPGTGKSQTIVNFIAAALVQGRTVLFVSEKLAALQVVRRRLDEAGLGLFCLQLHSSKAQKKEVLADVDSRIKRHHQLIDPGVLDDKLQLLERDKRRLAEYVDLINSSYGRLGHSVHDLLWGYQRRRRTLDFDVALIDQFTLLHAHDLTPADVEERRQRLRILASHLDIVLGDLPTVRSHSWYGITSAALTFADGGELLEQVSEIARLSDLLNHAVADLNMTLSCSLQPDPVTVNDFLSTVGGLQLTGGEVIGEISASARRWRATTPVGRIL